MAYRVMEIRRDLGEVGVVNTSNTVTAGHETNHLRDIETVLCKSGRMRFEVLFRFRNARRTSLGGVDTSTPEGNLDGSI